MIEGKIALVTGATSGIGLEIAKQLAKHGVIVAFNGLGNVEQAQEELSKISSNSHYYDSDLSDALQTKNMIETVHSTLGSIDILINNAGIQNVAPTQDFSVEIWDKIIAINLSAVFHTTKLCLPKMQEKNWGRIINIASVHGMVASVNKSAYVAAKHGVLGLTKVVALENAALNITCNAICPGWVKTPLVEKQIKAKSQQLNISFDEAKQQLLSEKQPSQEFVDTIDIAALVLFLCSDNAKQVRGSAWNMDGGWLAQ